MALPRLAVLSVLSAASSPCPDLNLIHYKIGRLKIFRRPIFDETADTLSQYDKPSVKDGSQFVFRIDFGLQGDFSFFMALEHGFEFLPLFSRRTARDDGQIASCRAQVAGSAFLNDDIAIRFGAMEIDSCPAADGCRQCNTAAEGGIFMIAVGGVGCEKYGLIRCGSKTLRSSRAVAGIWVCRKSCRVSGFMVGIGTGRLKIRSRQQSPINYSDKASQRAYFDCLCCPASRT